MLNREYLRRNLVTHPSAREVVEFVANITLLQALMAEEIRHRMEGKPGMLHIQQQEKANASNSSTPSTLYRITTIRCSSAHG